MNEATILNRTSSAWKNLRSSEDFNQFALAIENIDTTVLLFGGFPRRAALDVNPMLSRDIDLVIDSDAESIYSALQPWIVGRTRFGGFRLKVDGRSVDVWALADTWAFRSGVAEFNASPQNLVRTVFASTDALAVDLTRGRVYEHGFCESLEKREIKIVFLANPHHDLCVLRLLVTAYEYSFRLSRSARQFIRRQVGAGLTSQALKSIQSSHYGTERFTHGQLQVGLAQYVSEQRSLFGWHPKRAPSRRDSLGESSHLISTLNDDPTAWQDCLFEPCH